MTRWTVALALAALAAACGDRRLPGQPRPEPEVPDPRTLVDFDALYSQNCAGCHGLVGQGGLALGLAAPGYLAIAGDDVIRQAIAEGRRGTAMPAFAQSAGGLLSDAQVDALVRGVRAWAPASLQRDPEAPPYRAAGAGDATRGEQVFREHCGGCHAAGSAITDPAYLALVSDQSLRTTIIAGRPDLGSPDWRGGAGGKRLSADDVADTVAYLIAHRQPSPGQPYPGRSMP